MACFGCDVRDAADTERIHRTYVHLKRIAPNLSCLISLRADSDDIIRNSPDQPSAG